VREDFSGALFDEGFEAFDEFLLVLGGEVGVDDVAAVNFVFVVLDDALEWLVVFAFALLHAEDDVAIHLDEAAVAVPSEAGVTGGFFERADGVVVEAEVEDGVHHAGHGVACTGADGDEQREALCVAKFGAHDFLHVGDAGLHLRFEFLGVAALVGVVIGADFGGDGEASGDGQADARHLGEVGTFATEEGLHRAVAVGFARAPSVNVFGRLLRLGGFGFRCADFGGRGLGGGACASLGGRFCGWSAALFNSRFGGGFFGRGLLWCFRCHVWSCGLCE